MVSNSSKNAMTLIELVITLSIMAAVASIALVTLSDMGAVSRYEETERRGLAAQEAVIGRPGARSRFFNDLGRYPLTLSAEADQALAELYSATNVAEIAHYQRLHLPDTFEVSLSAEINAKNLDAVRAAVTNSTLGAGWRGPYLWNRNASFKTYTDNWGHSWLVATNAAPFEWVVQEDVKPSMPIRAIRSNGEGEGYLGEKQVYPFYASSAYGDLSVTLPDDALDTAVFLYVPCCAPERAPDLCEIACSADGVAYHLACGWAQEDIAPDWVATGAAYEHASSVCYSNIPVGTRKIWAIARVSETEVRWMRPQTIEIQPGHQSLTFNLNERLQ